MSGRLQHLYEQAANDLAERIVKELGGNIDSIVVFGSIAKKQAGEDSDIDVLIITDEKEARDKISSIRYEVDLKYDTPTTLIYLTREELEHRIKVGSPFIEDVLKQGIVLYDRNKTFEGIRERTLKVGR